MTILSAYKSLGLEAWLAHRRYVSEFVAILMAKLVVELLPSVCIPGYCCIAQVLDTRFAVVDSLCSRRVLPHMLGSTVMSA